MSKEDHQIIEIQGFPNYKVSREGRIWSFGQRSPHGKELAIKANTRGYPIVMPWLNGRGHAKTVHRLVAQAFIPNPENKPEVNHKDGNKFNNHVENLEWVTRKENFKHAWDNGLFSKRRIKGEKNGNAKMTDFKVRRMRLMKEVTPEISYAKLGEIFNVNHGTAYNIITRRKWKHI